MAYWGVVEEIYRISDILYSGIVFEVAPNTSEHDRGKSRWLCVSSAYVFLSQTENKNK